MSCDKTVETDGLKLSYCWKLERPYWVSLDWSRCLVGNNWAVERLDDSCRKFSFPVGLCVCLIPCLSENDTKSHLIYCTSCATLANVKRPSSQWRSDIQDRYVRSMQPWTLWVAWPGRYSRVTWYQSVAAITVWSLNVNPSDTNN